MPLCSWWTDDRIAPKRQPKVYSDEELLDKLKDYCIKYGKTKPRLDTNNDECHSNATYISRFGSMENALKLIGMEHLWGDKNKFIKNDNLQNNEFN